MNVAEEGTVPIDYSRYPPNWLTEIRPRILERAGHRCERCEAKNYEPHHTTGSLVVLTIAHLDHDPDNWDVTDDRLMALCQHCHLAYDAEHRRRERDKHQLELFT